jgi:16S rRNA (guanine527-N7)-methyltransferase
MDERVQLVEGARALGLSLDPGAVDRLERLLDELSRWNEAYNLTAIVDRPRMITHHLLDSLSVHAEVRGHAVADVGTGAGFPGLPLAIAAPDRRYTLVDSNNKKVRFVGHACRTLGLSNVDAVHGRVENLRGFQPFDTVVARAFAALPEILAKVAPLCGPLTRVLAMKGRCPDDEIAAVPPEWRICEARALEVPGLDEARTLVIIERDRGRPDRT